MAGLHSVEGYDTRTLTARSDLNEVKALRSQDTLKLNTRRYRTHQSLRPGLRRTIHCLSNQIPVPRSSKMVLKFQAPRQVGARI